MLIWKFSAPTVTRVPELYRHFTYGVVGDWLPPVLVVRPSTPVLRWLFTPIAGTETFAPGAAALLRLLVALAVFKAGQAALVLPVAVRPAFGVIEKLLLVVGVAWLARRSGCVSRRWRRS